MSITLSALMKQRYDTAANWTAQNPTLLAGEFGIESDTKKWKVGTGSTAWTSLLYSNGGTYPLVNADIAAAAAIVDTKLATIATAGKVSNSATTAASANTPSAIVARDVSGNFTAGTITAALTGAASANVLKAGDTMTGALAVTAGTAALPGIAVSGDLNTGIYSPGADQLAISTNGTGKLFVDATGNVGIGASPGFQLDLNRSGSPVFRVTNGTIAGYMQTEPGSACVRFGSLSNHSLAFMIAGSEVSRFDTSGRLGIGTTPVVDLDVAPAASTATFRIHARSNTTPVAAIELVRGTSTTFGADGSGDYRIKNATGNLSFEYGDSGVTSERARIDSSGRLLVGIIASPAYQLQVSTDSAGKPSSALWTIVSDERIKEDIELADLDLCYEAIKAIPLKRYKWRDEIYTAEQVTDRRKLGWIAQDVEAIFPKAVGTHEFKYNQVFEETIIPAVEEELDADGNVITPAQPERIEQGDLISEDVIEDCRNLNSDQLYAAMYGALQKLMAKVETLEASNTELLARLSALEGATG